jgi:hypothetical protein
VNDLQQELMSLSFDLDGALAAGQLELASWARENLLSAAVALFLSQADVSVPDNIKTAEARIGILDRLRSVNPDLARRMEELLVRPMAADVEGAQEDLSEVRLFLSEKLGVEASTRRAAVTTWAEGVRTLREVAAVLGVAGADSWYLADQTGGSERDWYDDILASIDAEGR